MSSSNSVNDFAFKLYKKLSAGKDENFFVSPFSIWTALSMCFSGARSETANQLKELLNVSSLNDTEVLELNQKYLTTINSLSNGVSLDTANKIYPLVGFNLNKEFVDNLSKYFKSEVQALDFSKSVESAQTINQWVESQTRNKIKNLIEPSILNALTRLVLVNAIYFKGKWLNQFDASQTYKEDFHLKDGTTRKVDMMKLLNKNFVFKINPGGLSANTCEFPYVGSSVAMTIILPHEGTSLENIENQLNSNVLQQVFARDTRSGKVHAYIPKFKLEYKSELSDHFKNLGAALPFDSARADFSGIAQDSKGLFISKVIHQAVVEVNEEGTEAAAATGAVMMLRCMPMNLPEEFKCNRPFLFVIHETTNNGVLFIGKYAQP